MQAILRRFLPSKLAQRLEVGPLVVDQAAEEAWWDGVLLPLNPADLRLLAVLAARPDEVATQRTILNEAWEPTN